MSGFNLPAKMNRRLIDWHSCGKRVTPWKVEAVEDGAVRGHYTCCLADQWQTTWHKEPDIYRALGGRQ